MIKYPKFIENVNGKLPETVISTLYVASRKIEVSHYVKSPLTLYTKIFTLIDLFINSKLTYEFWRIEESIMVYYRVSKQKSIFWGSE